MHARNVHAARRAFRCAAFPCLRSGSSSGGGGGGGSGSGGGGGGGGSSSRCRRRRRRCHDSSSSGSSPGAMWRAPTPEYDVIGEASTRGERLGGEVTPLFVNYEVDKVYSI